MPGSEPNENTRKRTEMTAPPQLRRRGTAAWEAGDCICRHGTPFEFLSARASQSAPNVQETGAEKVVWKRYFNYTQLEDLIMHVPYKDGPDVEQGVWSICTRAMHVTRQGSSSMVVHNRRMGGYPPWTPPPAQDQRSA